MTRFVVSDESLLTYSDFDAKEVDDLIEQCENVTENGYSPMEILSRTMFLLDSLELTSLHSIDNYTTILTFVDKVGIFGYELNTTSGR